MRLDNIANVLRKLLLPLVGIALNGFAIEALANGIYPVFLKSVATHE